MGELSIHLGPGDHDDLASAVERAGGRLVSLADAEALVWFGSVAEFPRSLPDTIRWVQLPSAGIESWLTAGVPDRDRIWTCAAGAYADTVAEHALTLLLAGVRALPTALALRGWDRSELADGVGTLRGSTVTIVGAGGIGRALVPLLTAVGAEVVAVNRRGRPVPGAVRTLGSDRLDEVWGATDHVVVAAPATPQTRHLVGARELAALTPTSWIVNIARGSLIDTEALVTALAEGRIGGAALDVTDPEPLPDGHPLWSEPRAIITPHVANPQRALDPALAELVADNVARRIAGDEVRGIIDLDAGY